MISPASKWYVVVRPVVRPKARKRLKCLGADRSKPVMGFFANALEWIEAASEDKTARLWDAETSEQISAPLVGHEYPVFSAAFSPDGGRIVTASADKTARLWNIFASTQKLVLAAKANVTRCLTTVQRTTFFLAPDPPEWCIAMEKWPYQSAAWKQWLANTRAGKTPQLPSEP
jgi:hypothetical protein